MSKSSPPTRRERDREYQRGRRAAGLTWDQQPENYERVAERKARWYDNLSWFDHRRQLEDRRRKALRRMAERNARRELGAN